VQLYIAFLLQLLDRLDHAHLLVSDGIFPFYLIQKVFVALYEKGVLETLLV
jgi:hypothetical protein